MTARKLLIPFFASLLPLVATAKDYPLHLSICEHNSSCGKCLEEIKVTLSVDMTAKAVFASGKTPEGALVKEQVSGCKITSINDWECDGSNFRGQVSAKNGELSYKPALITFQGKNQQLEVCLER